MKAISSLQNKRHKHLRFAKRISSVVAGAGSDLPGGRVGGFNPPNDFFGPPPPSLRRFELLGRSILTPVLVLHVSACGASTLLPVGDPQCFFSQIGHWSKP